MHTNRLLTFQTQNIPLSVTNTRPSVTSHAPNHFSPITYTKTSDQQFIEKMYRPSIVVFIALLVVAAIQVNASLSCQI